MFCPKCKDEFRPGFTRCARCNVDLVGELPPEEQDRRRGAAAPPAAPVRMATYCGYFSLDDAREARDRLRAQRIHSDILVRGAPDADWNDPLREEYWLRVDATRVREVAASLGEVPETDEPDAGSGFACGDCGQQVAEDAEVCPKCGARFDD